MVLKTQMIVHLDIIMVSLTHIIHFHRVKALFTFLDINLTNKMYIFNNHRYDVDTNSLTLSSFSLSFAPSLSKSKSDIHDKPIIFYNSYSRYLFLTFVQFWMRRRRFCLCQCKMTMMMILIRKIKFDICQELVYKTYEMNVLRDMLFYITSLHQSLLVSDIKWYSLRR